MRDSKQTVGFNPPALLSESLFGKIDDTNWEKAFELMKAGASAKWALLRGPLGWLAVGLAVLLSGMAYGTVILAAVGGLLSAYFLYRLVPAWAVIRRLPAANARLRDLLALMALEKRAGTDWKAFSEAYVESWDPGKVRVRLTALQAGP